MDRQVMRMAKRELLKTCHRAWRAVGVDVRRGWLSPSIPDGVKLAVATTRLTAEFRKDVETGTVRTQLELVELLHAIGSELGLTKVTQESFFQLEPIELL